MRGTGVAMLISGLVLASVWAGTAVAADDGASDAVGQRFEVPEFGYAIDGRPDSPEKHFARRALFAEG